MTKKSKRSTIFAVCVDNTGYPASLEAGKLYEVVPDAQAEKHGLIRVVDESGEDYGYSAKRFFVLDVPQALEKALKGMSATRQPNSLLNEQPVLSVQSISTFLSGKPSSFRMRAAHDSLDILRRDKVSVRNSTCVGSQKPVDLLLVAAESPKELQYLGRRRLQRGALNGRLKLWDCRLIPTALVIGQRRFRAASAGKVLIERRRQQFGVAKRIADALSRIGILVIARVTDQGPARPVLALAEEICKGTASCESLNPATATDALS